MNRKIHQWKSKSQHLKSETRFSAFSPIFADLTEIKRVYKLFKNQHLWTI